MNPKISVVMPMYNAEKYLNTAVISVLTQTFKDFELILVDDCSTDNTMQVAESFDDPRIKIFQTEKNMGSPGLTRNFGIEKAVGEYIYFMDCDDFILQNALETFLAAAEKNSVDVVHCTKWLIANDPEFKIGDNVNCRPINGFPLSPVAKDLKTRIFEELVLGRMHVAPWLFFYRRDFLTNDKTKIRFPNEVGEDVFFTLDILYATEKIIKIDTPLYLWRENNNSASHRSDRLNKNIKSTLVLHDYVVKKLSPTNDEKFISDVSTRLLDSVVGSYVIPFTRGGAEDILEEFAKDLSPRFGENTHFVLSLVRLYINLAETSKKYRDIKINLAYLSNHINSILKI